MTLGSSSSWVEGAAGEGETAWGLPAEGLFIRGGSGLAEQCQLPAEWSSSELEHRGERQHSSLRTSCRLSPFGQDRFEHRCSDLGWLPAQNGQIIGFLHLGLTWPNF